MADINVNLSEFEKTANNIDAYVSYMRSQMNNADSSVSSMLSAWNGSDAMLFKMRWDTVNEEGSTFNRMCSKLSNYSEAVRFSLRSYREAQDKCIDLSKRLLNNY